MQMSLAKIRRGLSIGACLIILTPFVFARADSDIPWYGDATLFPEINHWTTVKWATQATFAPGTLKYVIPMNAYRIETLKYLSGEKLSNIFDNDEYIAMLPPRDGEKGKPAACGFPVVNLDISEKIIQFALNGVDVVGSEPLDDLKKQRGKLDQYSNCHVVSNSPDSLIDWYIATPQDLNIPVNARIWTKTGAWASANQPDADTQATLQ